MKVAIYVRVSTNDQSTEMQLNDLHEYVKARGLEIYKIYEDAGISGTKESRPSLNKLMDDARKRKFKAVLVWKFDRFARSLKHLVTALDDLTECGIEFISYKENIDTTTTMGRAMFGMIGVMAQIEREMIRDRVVAGLKNAKAKGRLLGRRRSVNYEKVKMLASEGLPVGKIAAQLGVSHTIVGRILKESKASV